MTKSVTTDLRVGGKTVAVSNLDKVLYPSTHFTKGNVIDYYIRISRYLLPHLKDRPLSLKRYPEGVEKQFFYEKRCPPYRPRWVNTIAVWSKGNQETIHFCAVNDLPSLVWAANLANLELHTYLMKRQDLSRPTCVVFDLDPGEGTTILDAARLALWTRRELDELGLKSFVKTSGSKGLQVYAPLNSVVDFDESKAFARAVAEHLERLHPGEVVSKMTKSLRRKKVFVDWSQNDAHKTTVCVYSLRGKREPMVSTPLKWAEVEAAVKKGAVHRLEFGPSEVLKRVGKFGDLFEPVLKLKQKLPKLPSHNGEKGQV